MARIFSHLDLELYSNFLIKMATIIIFGHIPFPVCIAVTNRPRWRIELQSNKQHFNHVVGM